MSLAGLPQHQGGADDLARLLARALLAGHWQPGEAFPRELDVCAHFDVSRNKVRNALASLTATGLIERTAGRGTRVREIGEWHLLDPLISDWMTGIDSLDPKLVRAIFAFRYSAEPVVARLAAEAANADDIQRLETAFQGMTRTAMNPEERGLHAEYDVAFHDAIYQGSHNLVWRQMGHLLRPSIIALIHSSQAHVHHEHEGLDDSLARHNEVLETIRRRDPSAAEHAAREVLKRTAIDLGIVDDPPASSGAVPAANAHTDLEEFS
ncbi:FadR/GntR family transcriptional regulator [Halomonas urumqiensis]|uniref:FadR family transcriptional regulator n=1 Tax=Halomonas urumqiensis TaxID=1684789 RepID=A0A2N7UHJ3_9GAMM|nr:FCD domain-containing protein [Halomonas urumqiensis]PMR79885.1 FadR family transcriptional regulator [Halomonas urumqiensis]PTB02090.1 FadR family transcriptional regulator [Halomonas urumqiensis]GHE21535.1 GntR family transcriptional regulator [Halomonas urumqiensis]